MVSEKLQMTGVSEIKEAKLLLDLISDLNNSMS